MESFLNASIIKTKRLTFLPTQAFVELLADICDVPAIRYGQLTSGKNCFFSMISGLAQTGSQTASI